jgi:trk system potassium uptake protein TrkH
MFIGASAGSTAGGLKISRIIIILKTVRLRIKKMLKPREVIPLKLDGDSIPVEVGNSAINYISIYLVFFIISMILIAFNGKDLTTTFTSVLTCISNAGPALGEVGSAGNFSGFSAFSKIIFSLIMLFGRLEIIPMIILISPSTWRGFTKTDAAFSKKL